MSKTKQREVREYGVGTLAYFETAYGALVPVRVTHINPPNAHGMSIIIGKVTMGFAHYTEGQTIKSFAHRMPPREQVDVPRRRVNHLYRYVSA